MDLATVLAAFIVVGIRIQNQMTNVYKENKNLKTELEIPANICFCPFFEKCFRNSFVKRPLGEVNHKSQKQYCIYYSPSSTVSQTQNRGILFLTTANCLSISIKGSMRDLSLYNTI